MYLAQRVKEMIPMKTTHCLDECMPIASRNSPGVVKIGRGIDVDNGRISVNRKDTIKRRDLEELMDSVFGPMEGEENEG